MPGYLCTPLSPASKSPFPSKTSETPTLVFLLTLTGHVVHLSHKTSFIKINEEWKGEILKQRWLNTVFHTILITGVIYIMLCTLDRNEEA